MTPTQRHTPTPSAHEPAQSNVPPVMDVTAIQRWLRLGAQDLRRNPWPGLLHGVALVVVGWLLVGMAQDKFWLLAGAYSGFLIVGPVLVTSLYEVSRGQHYGYKVDLWDVVFVWLSFDKRLIGFGGLLALAGVGWVVSSAGLITAFAVMPIHKPMDFLHHVVLAQQGYLFELWLLMGGLLAAPMFASSVVALPMLVSSRASVWQAVLASWRICGAHPGLMAAWAATLMCLVGMGMLTAMLGLVFIVPWLAHASWHAYADAQAWLNAQDGAR
jgi:uncharacterized membrane protein